MQWIKNPKANKQHLCMHCPVPIVKGTVYERGCMTYDGTMHNWKAHKECSRMYVILNADAYYVEDWADVKELLSPDEWKDYVAVIGCLYKKGVTRDGV